MEGTWGLAGGAAPISYEVDGTQYIAVALGHGNLGGGTLAVFKLGSSAVKPFPGTTYEYANGTTPSIKGLTKINPWEHADSRTHHVVIDIVAGATSDNNGFNFDGYSKGKANFIVPVGWNLSIVFTNKAALPHSAALASAISATSATLIDNMCCPIETPDALQGVPGGAPAQYINITATYVGKNYLVCLVPGHLTAGMWDYLTISTTATMPSVEVSS